MQGSHLTGTLVKWLQTLSALQIRKSINIFLFLSLSNIFMSSQMLPFWSSLIVTPVIWVIQSIPPAVDPPQPLVSWWSMALRLCWHSFAFSSSGPLKQQSELLRIILSPSLGPVSGPQDSYTFGPFRVEFSYCPNITLYLASKSHSAILALLDASGGHQTPAICALQSTGESTNSQTGLLWSLSLWTGCEGSHYTHTQTHTHTHLSPRDNMIGGK